MRKPFDAGAILAKLEQTPSQPGDFEIRFDGSRFHQGGRIERAPMVALFASILHRGHDGRHFLITPVEQHEVQVDDAALIIVDVEQKAGALHAEANTGETAVLGSAHAIAMREVDGQTIPYMAWHRGLEARFSRSAYYDLVEFGVEEAGRLVIKCHDETFDLGPVA